MPSDPVLREAAYYEEYARQYGDAAALRVAVDDVTKLRAALSAPSPSPAAPERGGEPVALGWTMLRADGMPTGVMSCERARVERICDEHNRDEVAGFPFRVVALAPVDGASGAAAKRGSEGRTAREEPAP